MVIPYLKKIQTPYKPRDTSLEFCWHWHLFTRNYQSLLYREMQIKITFSLILLTFIELLKVVLIDMIVILMMSVNLAIPGLLNAKGF